MERAARLIRSNKVSSEVFSDEDLTRAIWPGAVGKTIATHTLRLKLVRTRLIVEVEDSIWQKQLYPLTGQILERLRKVTGSEIVKELEFRVGVRRREAARDTQNHNAADEAESIQDPVLKKVYRLSRKKATA